MAEPTKNGKLERHAETAVDDLTDANVAQFVAGIYALPATLYSKVARADVNSRLAKQMLAGDRTGFKPAAKERTSKALRNQVLCDIAAAMLLTHYATAQQKSS